MKVTYYLIMMQLQTAKQHGQIELKRDSPWQRVSPNCSSPSLPSRGASPSVFQASLVVDLTTPSSSCNRPCCRYGDIAGSVSFRYAPCVIQSSSSLLHKLVMYSLTISARCVYSHEIVLCNVLKEMTSFYRQEMTS